MATYPSSIWSGNTRGVNLADAHTHTKWHDDIMGEVIAMQTELGTAPSGSSATVKAKLDLIDVSTSTWTSPISAGITVGSGSTSALKLQLGDMMHCWFFFQFGVGSAITTSVDLALPATASSASFIHGDARFDDSGTDYAGYVYGTSTTVARIEVFNASATYLTLNNLSATIPFTWATGDTITASLNYPI